MRCDDCGHISFQLEWRLGINSAINSPGYSRRFQLLLVRVSCFDSQPPFSGCGGKGGGGGGGGRDGSSFVASVSGAFHTILHYLAVGSPVSPPPYFDHSQVVGTGSARRSSQHSRSRCSLIYSPDVRLDDPPGSVQPPSAVKLN